VYPRSIEVEGVKEVYVINNEFNINVIKVVSAKDGKRLHISCNRLLGEPRSPECVDRPVSSTTSSYHSLYYSHSSSSTESSTTELSTTTTPPTTSPPLHELMGSTTNEIFIGITAGVGLILLVLLVLVIWLCCRNRGKRDAENPIVKETPPTATDENLNEDNKDELNLLLATSAEPTTAEQVEDRSTEDGSTPTGDEEARNKFSSPVWIQEIHRNKIFAKQRSINSPTEEEKKMVEGTGETAPLAHTPRRVHVRIPVRSISEILEFEDQETEDEDQPIIQSFDKATIQPSNQSTMKQPNHESNQKQVKLDLTQTVC